MFCGTVHCFFLKLCSKRVAFISSGHLCGGSSHPDEAGLEAQHVVGDRTAGTDTRVNGWNRPHVYCLFILNGTVTRANGWNRPQVYCLFILNGTVTRANGCNRHHVYMYILFVLNGTVTGTNG